MKPTKKPQLSITENLLILDKISEKGISELIQKSVIGGTEDIPLLLRTLGITAMQKQAGMIPSVVNTALPITEQAFSEQTRSQRKTFDIRTKQWIQATNSHGEDIRILSYGELKEIEFITYKKYLEENE